MEFIEGNIYLYLANDGKQILFVADYATTEEPGVWGFGFVFLYEHGLTRVESRYQKYPMTDASLREATDDDIKTILSQTSLSKTELLDKLDEMKRTTRMSETEHERLMRIAGELEIE